MRWENKILGLSTEHWQKDLDKTAIILKSIIFVSDSYFLRFTMKKVWAKNLDSMSAVPTKYLSKTDHRRGGNYICSVFQILRASLPAQSTEFQCYSDVQQPVKNTTHLLKSLWIPLIQ